MSVSGDTAAMEPAAPMAWVHTPASVPQDGRGRTAQTILMNVRHPHAKMVGSALTGSMASDVTVPGGM